MQSIKTNSYKTFSGSGKRCASFFKKEQTQWISSFSVKFEVCILLEVNPSWVLYLFICWIKFVHRAVHSCQIGQSKYARCILTRGTMALNPSAFACEGKKQRGIERSRNKWKAVDPCNHNATRTNLIASRGDGMSKLFFLVHCWKSLHSKNLPNGHSRYALLKSI